MRVLVIKLSIFLIATASAIPAEKKTEKVKTDVESKSSDAIETKSPEAIVGELQALASGGVEDLDDQDIDDVLRKKKSATTTFCVEIRPSGQDQKSFQVCEPAADANKEGYGVPAPQSYYPTQNYGGSEQQKPHPAPYQSQAAQVSPQKPAAAYSGPVKTFSAPSSAPAAAGKPYQTHMTYGGYRTADDVDMAEEKDAHFMTMANGSSEEAENEDTNRQANDPHMRTAFDGYSSSYGAPPSYAPMAPKNKHHPHSARHGNNGLYITCQPNLAGYAHPNVHQPASVPISGYNYRSASGRFGSPYQPYRPQQQPHESYQHQTNYNPAFQHKPNPAYQQSAQPNNPAEVPHAAYPPAYSPQPAPAFPPQPAPAFSPQSASTFSAPPASYKSPVHPNPEYKSQPYKPPAYLQEYKPPAQTYPPPPPPPAALPPAYSQPDQAYLSPEYKPQTYSSPPAPVPEYKPHGYPPLNPEYGVVKPPSPMYVPPGTYRAAEVMDNEKARVKDEKDEKESHTLQKMEEIIEQRAAGGPWGADLAMEDTNKNEQRLGGSWRQAGDEQKDEHRSASGWSQAEGTVEATKAHDKTEENEVDAHI
ncbi:hypothetical protein JTB14_023602 [Gonioctena quinquepunctata]|nr:hypothetical protein JTB14_023602 [Gonioctena quinquepunctata]